MQRLGLLVMSGWSQLIIERIRYAFTYRPLHWRLPGLAQILGWTSRVTLAAATTAA